MATVSDRAICIRHWDFSETSQTVSLFGREQGVFRGIAKGSRREKSNFSGGVDLLTLGDVTAIIKTTTDLATVTEWGLNRVWWKIRRDPAANRTAYYLADCIGRMLEKRDPHPGIFDGLVSALDRMEAGESAENTVLCFQWLLLVDTGYKPKIELAPDSGDTLAFSAREGGLVEGDTVSGLWRVRRSTIELLRGLDESGRVDDADETTVRRASRLLAAYLREIMGSEPNTMRLVFPDLAGGRV